MTAAHVPVMLAEVIRSLAPRDGETFIDGTFGAGGYSAGLLEAARCTVLGLDRDPSAIASAAALRARYPGRLTVVQATFSRLDEAARAAGADFTDGVVLDIGVSSMQLDQPERGFSFQADGPLDMRMGGDGPTAADVVNGLDQDVLADVLYHLGEEHRARAIARAIVTARAAAPITRTRALAEIVERVLGRQRFGEKHPATRTFQALRIYVNDELGELVQGLAAAERALKPGGRLVVVTFHSLEDRIVKRFLAERSGKSPSGSRHSPAGSVKSEPPSFRIVNPSPLTPSKGELEVNPRARSARLRAAVRTDAPAWRHGAPALEVPRIDL